MYKTEFLGWDIVWTGWKPCQGDDSLVGQWIAHKGNKRFYVSVPGGYGPYELGDEFVVKDKWITSKTELGKALRAWEDGLERIHSLIRSVEDK
jgi:hypothetical protein